MHTVKRFATSVAACILLSASVFAQNDQADRKAFHQEAQRYAKENIVPVMKPKRQQLETYLSKEEKARLSEIRTEMQAHRKEMQNRKGQFGGRPEPGSRPDEAQISQMKAQREAHRATMESVKAIADNHKTEIDQLLADVQPKMEQWRTDIHAIAEKNGLQPRQRPEGMGKGQPMEGRPRNGEGFHGDKPGQSGGPGMRGPGMGGPGMMGLMNITQPVGFLLWDADGEFPIMNEMGQGVRTFPNPAAVSSTLEYNVGEAGQVTIHILNDKGIVVKTLVNEVQTKGRYEIQTSVSELSNGIYFYQIKTPSGLESRKILIDK
ncbi:MAG: T9SS type A sorting domain-containing protein [Bacteroidia bacterium]